ARNRSCCSIALRCRRRTVTPRRDLDRSSRDQAASNSSPAKYETVAPPAVSCVSRLTRPPEQRKKRKANRPSVLPMAPPDDLLRTANKTCAPGYAPEYAAP